MVVAGSGRKSSDTIRGIDRYQLIDQLGEGGMGVVWRALDTKTGSEVAIKIMKDISDATALELFKKEWKALARLSHPNIVDVRDVDEVQENGELKPFFVMPLLRGDTLAELMRNSSGRLTIARVVEIFTQVCRGLQVAHDQSLIHRDLKPSNIFVLSDDTAKIIDFGVVYLAGSHTSTGLKGTLQYMSPEQVEMKQITGASDLFSLGVILYESLTGRKPFAYPTASETAQAILTSMPPAVSELNPSIPHPISQVVHKCLAKKPLNRFASARELSETLIRALHGEPVFDSSSVRERLERVKSAIKDDLPFASELLSEIESEGHVDHDITVLRKQIELVTRKQRIDHLLAGARARINHEEIPLGLEKLRELLELDPENSDALALKATAERARSEKQVSKWIELAKTHLNNRDFAAARQAAQEALANRVGDPRAIELLGKIESMELEARKVREQKELLYNTAMRAYQNGEIDSALDRLARLFSVVHSKPEAAVPDRDAVYESFYKEVRSEHDVIVSRLEEAQKLLAEEQFPQALEICMEQLAKYPQNSSFQALKIHIEDAERQKMSADLATASRMAEGEPDLDRRANIWAEAAKTHPNETQFSQQLKVTCERRDLVNSIVAKARQFDQRAQYSEALSQWDILRNIYPRYPGLDFELQQCRRKRDLQMRNEEKESLIEEIENLREVRNFAKALEQTHKALVEFPGDTELLGLEKLFEETLKRCSESNRLMQQAQLCITANNLAEAATLLEDSLRLDPYNAPVQDALISVLTEQARTLLHSDLSRAESLFRRTSELNSNHRLVRSLSVEIGEANRQKYVGQCLNDARSLQAVGNSAEALDRIREGRKKYPQDPRLEQFEELLVKDNPALQRRQERMGRLASLTSARETLDRDPAPDQAMKVLRLAQETKARDSEDPETVMQVAQAERAVRKVMGVDDLDELLRRDTESANAAPPPSPVPVEPVADSDAGAIDATRLFTPPTAKPPVQPKPQEPAPAAIKPPQPKPAEKPRAQKPPAAPRAVKPAPSPAMRRMILIGSIAAVVLVAAGFGVYWFLHRPVAPQPRASTLAVRLTTTPADAVFKVNGQVHSGALFTIPVGKVINVGVSHAGYQDQLVQLRSDGGDQKIALTPWPVRVSVSTSEPNGSLSLDAQPAQQLVQGSIDLDIPPDGQTHALLIKSGTGQIAKLNFKADPGQRPVLDSTVLRKDMVAIANLGAAGTLYGGSQLSTPTVDGQAVKLSDSGVDLPASSEQDHVLSFNNAGKQASVTISFTERPSLTVRSVGLITELYITTNAESATLLANGKPVPRSGRSWRILQPGNYSFTLSADKYLPQTWTTNLQANQALRLDKHLDVAPVAPRGSNLLISGSTPGAQVLIDGYLVGALDASGNGSILLKSELISDGQHNLRITKTGFCTLHEERITLAPPAEIKIQNAPLEQCASISLQSGTPNAKAKIQRTGDGSPVDLTPGQKALVRAGSYLVSAEASGFQPYSSTFTLLPGESHEVVPEFRAVQRCSLQSADQATLVGGWLKPRNNNEVVRLGRGCVNVNLEFERKNKPEWFLESPGGAARIEWKLDGRKLTRKYGSHSFELNTGGLVDTNAPFGIHVRVDGQHVRVTNTAGATLDDFTAQDPGFEHLGSGNVSVRTAGQFKFTGN